jgi:hypothetical protein
MYDDINAVVDELADQLCLEEIALDVTALLVWERLFGGPGATDRDHRSPGELASLPIDRGRNPHAPSRDIERIKSR